jgi:uncharacterized damage-inducible protein DinB
MLPIELRAMIAHAEWADARVWGVVVDVDGAVDDAGVRDRLHHVHQVQWAYLSIWRGEPLRLPDVTDFAGAAALRNWGRDFHREAATYLDSLSEEDEAREIRFPWADRLVERFGAARPATFAETVVQLASHSTYHRGQVNARLRELGGEPPLTDFIAWIWEGCPPPAWDVASRTSDERR